MARLKVPGRPGSRIGRLRVPYSTDGHEIESDPTFRYITHVQNGLQEFRELFGDSDEEEFLGFTDRDVKKAERKLQMRSSPQKAQGVAQQRQLRKKIAESISAMADDGLVEPVEVGPTLVEVIQPSSRAARLKERNVAKKQSGSHTLDKSSAAKGPIKKGTSRVSARTSKVVKIEPASRRRVGRPRKNDLASDFVDQVIEQQVKEAEQPEESVEELDNKNVADSNPESDLDTRSLRSRKVENSPLARRPSMAKTTLSKITSVHKGHGQQRAKMLLERAKRTGAKKEKSPKATDAVELKTGATAPERRKFHLPATSSRSSRKIIPNKRFLLEEKIGSATFARSPKIKENVQQSSSGECILELGCVSQSTSCGTSVPCGELSTSTSSMGLLDQPLIVDGKRERKPSVKLIQKLSEGYIPERKSPCKSPEKFSRRERRGVELERDLRAKQRSGKTILQKAKFRLNQAALNRSKAALACSLKKQMRKEDRQLRKALSKEAVPPSTSFSSSPPEQKLFSHFGLKPTPSLVLSPLKFGLSAAASEPVVFGASSLPAVPKFALESTTESLPTFQSPNRGKGLDPVEKKVASPFKHDDSHVQEMMKERYGYICPICTDKLSCKLKYYGVYCCRSCARFYRARILDLADSGEEPICSENGNCVMSAEKKFNNCHGCRFVHCKKVFPKPQNIRELHRMLKVEGGKLRLTADSKSGSEEKFSPKAVKRGDQSTKAKKSKISSEASSEDSKVLIADESAETCSTELQDLAEPSASLRALLANKSPIKTEDESYTQDCMQAVNELISAPPVNQGDVKLSEPVTPSSSSVIPIQTPSPGQGVGATQHTPGSDGTATSPRRVPTHGPRIKHVCRRAAVALGTPATFPSPDSVTLSALPTMEKQKILSDREKEDRPGTPDSDDMSLDEIIRQAKDESFEMSPNKKTPNRAFKALVPRGFKTSPDKRMNAPDIVTGRRRIRCNKCAGCNSKDCGKCVNCRDKPKFGGEGKLKQACMKKKCSNPQLRDKPGRLTPPSNAPKPRKIIIEQDAHPGAQNRKLPVETYSRGLAQSSNSRPPGRFSKTSILAPSPKKGNKPMAKAYGMKNKYLSGELAGRIINADFKENYDIDVAWLRGLALISSTPMCVRTVCLLCGSAGQEELIFCNICCEPFHTFCLDPGEAPKQENIENWCCRRCQFCHVCGRQNNLLQCNKCQETYHPGCLGSNYPTKPSKKKKIWVCTKCVRCKSCGATTPGHSQNATWMYDFSLCYKCGILMDKGNYCPVCHKCYSDDDWESKMIQCATCQCWVHSKCEEMSDEMYQVFSYLPEDITFNCRVCRPERPPPWLQILKKELEAGFSIIIDTILAYKCSVHLERISEKLVDTDPKTTDMKIKAITSSSTTIESKPSSERTSIVQDDKTTPKTEDQLEKADVPMDTETVSESDHNPAASAQEDKQPSRISEKNRLEDESAKEQTIPSCMDTGTANQQDCNTKLDDKVNTDDIDPGKSNAPATSEDGREQGRENKGASEQAANEPTNVTQSEGELPPPSGETTQKCDEGGSGNAEELPDTVSTPTLESQPCDINPEDAQHPGSALAETSQNPIANKEPQSMNISNTSSCTDSAPETSAIMDVGDTPTASLKGDVNDLTQEQVDKSKNMLEEKKDFPRDFQSVRKKLNNREYKNVDEFIEDIGRIIQHNMQLEEIPIVRKKACNTIRSSFIKTIGQCFPWFNIKSTLLWGNDKNLPSNMLPDAVIPPYADHEYAQWLHREETPMSPQPSPFKKVIATPRKIAIPIMASFDDDAASSAPSEPPDIGQIGDDTRRCLLCGQSGDESPDESGRMLYAGQDDWVHINCALWSAEVYEEVDGTLQRVQNAMARGKKMKCDHCQKAGATVGCCQSGCHANYHFKCAKVRECLFQEDKKVYCKQHFYSVDTEVIQDNKFAVQRRACIEQDPSKSIKRTWQRGLCSDLINIVIGSMTVENLGKLGLLSDRKNALCPVNYCVTRVFWSTVDPRRRCIYTCRIIEVNPMEEEIDIVMKDITVIHEESHPDYDGDKVKQLMEAAQRISTRKSRLEKEEKSEKERRTRHGVGDCKYTKCDEYFIDDSPAPKKSAAKMKQVSRGSSNAPKKSGLGIPYQPSEKGGPLQGMPYQPAVLLPESSLSQLPKNRPSAIQIWKEKNLGGMKLAKSWPGTAVSSPTSSAPPLPEPRPKSLPDLRGLSPATVKLLGQTDLSKFKQTSKSVTDCANDLVLGKIADRLNTAAAKNKTTKQTVNTATHREGNAEKPVPTCEAGTISTLPRMALPPPVERLVGPVRTCGLIQNPEPMQLGEGEQTKTIPQVDGMIDSSSDSECDSSDTDFCDSSLPQVDGKYDDKSKNENNGLTTEGRVTRRMSNGPLKVPNTDNSKSYGNAPGSSENNSNLDQHKIDSRIKVDKEHIENFELQFGKAKVVLEPTNIPLHDKIAQKIKAESLARSSPSEQGPFKCNKCKRLYRTKESCEKHAETCTFEVSTDEEDEEEEDEQEGDSPSRPIRVEIFQQTPEADSRQRHTRSGGERTTSPRRNRSKSTKRKFEHEEATETGSTSSPPGKKLKASKHGPDGESAEFCVPIKNQVPIVSIVPIRTSEDGISFEDAAGVRSAQNNSNRRSTRSARNNTVTSGDLMSSRPEIDCNNAPPQQTNEKAASNENTDDAGNTDGTLVNGNCESAVAECENSEIAGPSSTQSCGTESVRSDSLTPVIDNSARGPQSVPLFHPEKETILSSFPSSSVIRLDHQKPPTKTAVIAPLPPAEGRNVLTVESVAPKVPGSMCDALIGQNVNPSPALVDATVATLHTQSRHVDGGGDAVQGVPPSVQNLANSSACESQSNENADERNQGKPEKKNKSPPKKKSPTKSLSPSKISPKGPPGMDKLVQMQIISQGPNQPSTVRILPKVVSSPPPVQQTFVEQPIVPSQLKQFASPSGQMGYVGSYINADGISQSVTILPQSQIVSGVAPNMALQQNVRGIQVIQPGVMNIGGVTQQQLQQVLVSSNGNQILTSVSLAAPVSIASHVNCTGGLIGSPAAGLGSAVVQATPLYDQTLVQQPLPTVQANLAEQQVVSPPLVQPSIGVPTHRTILTNQMGATILSQPGLRTGTMNIHTVQSNAFPQPQLLGIRPSTAVGQTTSVQTIQGNTTAAQMLKDLVSQKAVSISHQSSNATTQALIAGKIAFSSSQVASGATSNTTATVSSAAAKPVQRNPLPITTQGNINQLVAMTPAGVPSVKYHQGMLSHADMNPKVRLKRLSPKRKSPKNSPPKRNQPQKQSIIVQKRKQIIATVTDVNELKKKKFESSLEESIRQSLKATIMKKTSEKVIAPQTKSVQQQAEEKVRVAHAQGIELLKKQQQKIAGRVLKDNNKVLAKKSRKDPMKNLRKDVGHAHPLIHPTHQSAFLPVAALEEEVEDSPLLAAMMEEEERRARENRKKNSPYLMFEITSDDGFKCKAESYDEAWKMVTDKVADARSDARMKQLSFSGVNGLSMFGLSHDAIIFLLEQLTGAETCKHYQFRFHEYERREVEEEPEVNPSGCARAEPFISRRPFEMFSFLLSKYRDKPTYVKPAKGESEISLKPQRRTTSMDLPMAMRYRHLRSNAREAVGVYRSGIHGRGLFCKRNIDAGEMVIEYAGEVIRGILTDKRENYYESKGIGCYMFRIDDDDVVDATVNGNSARFINHSCDPNCYSKVIQVDNQKHIVIFAQRPIKRGEELTYDYKFPIEEVKIPCTCAAKRCRKFLN